MTFYHHGRRLAASLRADHAARPRNGGNVNPWAYLGTNGARAPDGALVLILEDGSRFTPVEFVRAGLSLVSATDAERRDLAAWLGSLAPARKLSRS